MPTIAASKKVRSVSSNAASAVPNAMVSGIPTPRRRRGSLSFRRRTERLIPAASVNSTIARAISLTKSTVWSSSSSSTRPSPAGPSTKPATTNTIGAVKTVPSSRRERRPKANTMAASTVRSTTVFSAGAEHSRAIREKAAHGSSTLRNLGHAGLGCSAVWLMTPENMPVVVLGTSAKARSRRSSSNPITRKRPAGMATSVCDNLYLSVLERSAG